MCGSDNDTSLACRTRQKVLFTPMAPDRVDGSISYPILRDLCVSALSAITCAVREIAVKETARSSCGRRGWLGVLLL